MIASARGTTAALCRLVALALLGLVGCGGAAGEAPVLDAQAAGHTACGDSAFFTACVQRCGEAVDSESVAATCVGGQFRCEPPRVPASDCPAGSWTSARLACGPWVAGYDCGNACASCASDGTWTCAACPTSGG